MQKQRSIYHFNSRKLVDDEQFDANMKQIIAFCKNEHLIKVHMEKTDRKEYNKKVDECHRFEKLAEELR
jgi:uncharacterized protein YifE (UPF0438 family)